MHNTIVLMVSAALAAILHTLVPDHEIPLAMIGRAQNWTVKKMAGVTLIAGVIHISVSMGIGVVALIGSAALSQFVANSAQLISGFLLIAFGTIYALLSWRRVHGGHSHAHGPHQAHHHHGPTQGESDIAEVPSGKTGTRWSAWIVAIVGIAPCFTLIPVLIAAVPHGVTTTLWVMLSFAVATIATMVILTSIALKTLQFVTRLEKVEKHMEILTGVIILAVGVWLLIEISLGL